jgi:hypothetical protein
MGNKLIGRHDPFHALAARLWIDPENETRHRLMSKPEADQSRPTSDQRSPRDSPRWSAGIVNHGGFDDLTRCIGSLTRQSAPPSEIFVYDTGIDSYKLDSIQADHRDVIFEVGENLGYAGGANRVI